MVLTMSRLILVGVFLVAFLANVGYSQYGGGYGGGGPILPPGWVISPYCAKILQANACTGGQDVLCVPAGGQCSKGNLFYGPWVGDTIRGVTNFPVPEAGLVPTVYGFRPCYVEITCDYYGRYGQTGTCINPQFTYYGLANAGTLGTTNCFAP
jgi:hypothetical protein